MILHEGAVWDLIIGLSLMIVGGLMLWTYSARRRQRGEGIVLSASGPEAEATQRFHVRLARWFHLYGVGLTLVGAVMLLKASFVLL